MRRLDLEDLCREADAFDDAVCKTGDIDHFCSSTDWIVPAAYGLMGEREPWIHAADDCYWAFMRSRHISGFSYLEPLEAMWALSCPLIGPDPKGVVEGLMELQDRFRNEFELMALTGIGRDSALLRSLVAVFSADRSMKVQVGQSTQTLRIDLRGGVDEYLARRSGKFRAAMRRLARGAKDAGIVVEEAGRWASPQALFQRILAVEQRAWKGLANDGISVGSMRQFYQLMLPRLHRRKAHRILFARQRALDVGYIFGGIQGDEYRGLQFSYDAEFARFGLGNLLQMEQLRRIGAEGIPIYDLGMDMPYKRRWSDYQRETLTLLVSR